MKRIKINFAIIAMVLGLTAVFAFKSPAKHTKFDGPFWQYSGVGSNTDPANYTLVDGDPGCDGTDVTCAIEAPASSNPNQPSISPALATRITNNDISMGDVELQFSSEK